MGKYSLPKENSSVHDRVEDTRKKVDALLGVKRLDEQNPMEQAIKFDLVKQHPPEAGTMKVQMYEKERDGELPTVVSEAIDKTIPAHETQIKQDVFFSIDLNTLIQADVAACPSNVMPMLIDEYVGMALAEKKAYEPEKRKRDEFNWWWLVFAAIPIPAIILIIFTFL